MEGPAHCDSVSERVNSALDLKHTYVNNNHRVHSENHLVGDSVVAELANALRETLLVEDAQEAVLGFPPSTDVVEVACFQEKGKLCEAFEGQQTDFMTTKTVKVLSKCATFPCSQMSFCAATLDGIDDTPEMALHEQCFMKSKNPACTRSISLPTPPKLVSAMKGGREKQGMPLKKLTVTWTEDVYDPPTTLLSHTVKSHHGQQRSRTNKKNSKHNKHKKKSSRGSNSDNKQQHRKHAGNSAPTYKSSAASDRVDIGDLHESSAAELMDFSVAGQDSKCGSSFLRTTLGRVHISVAEAT